MKCNRREKLRANKQFNVKLFENKIPENSIKKQKGKGVYFSKGVQTE